MAGHPTYHVNVIKLRACLHGGGGPQIGEVTCGGSPHLSCKRDQIKIRDYMIRWVTSPTWGPPPPCKQTLSKVQMLGSDFKEEREEKNKNNTKQNNNNNKKPKCISDQKCFSIISTLSRSQANNRERRVPL